MKPTSYSIQAQTAATVLRAVLETTQNLFVAVDRDYRLLAFNRLFQSEFQKVYGKDISVGESLKEILGHLPQEQLLIMGLWARGIAGEEFTITQELGDKVRRLYELRFYPIRGEDEEILGTFQLIQDVTQNRLVIQELGDADANFSGLFGAIPSELRIFAEAMPQMAFVADSQGNTTYFNQRHYDYFGLEKDDNRDWKHQATNMLHPDDLAPTIDRWTQAVRSGQPYEMEYRLRRYDGSFRWHLARALPVKTTDGIVVRWVGTNTDIDEQKKVAQQLDELLREVEFEKNRFEAVMKNMPAAVIIGEAPSGKLVFSNNKLAQVWGHELIPSEKITDYGDWVGFHPDGRRYLGHEWPLARSIAHGEVINDEHVDIMRPNGTPAVLSLSSTPIYNHKGEIVAGVVICQDVTELKKAIRSRDEFLSICSHELKTPLTSLKLASQLASRNIQRGDLDALSPQRIIPLLRQYDEQVNRLTRLVEDMVDISRISSGRLSLERKKFDFSQLAKEVGERMTALFEDRGSKLDIEITGPAICYGDPFRIEQVITNLLTNAAKYGEGKPVIMKATQENGTALISIKDQGKGIAPENYERIFNRYERLVSASEVSGLGLGLFITKQIIELHHGRIWPESLPGQETTFYVSIPLEQ